jgi:hypothetical protein
VSTANGCDHGGRGVGWRVTRRSRAHGSLTRSSCARGSLTWRGRPEHPASVTGWLKRKKGKEAPR